MTEQTVLICCLIGASQMTWGVIVPVLPVYIERFGAAAAALGPIIAAFGLGRTLANIPAGVLLRWWRPRPYLTVVLLGLAAITAATALVPSQDWLIAARLGAGVLGGAAVTIGFAVLIAGAPEERRGRVMATATVVQMSGAALGSLLGGVSVTLLGSQAAFPVAAVPLVLALLWDRIRPAHHYWRTLTDAPDPVIDPAPDPVAVVGGSPSSSSPPRRSSSASGIVAAVVVLASVSFAAFFARFAGEQGITPVLGYEVGGLTPLTLGVALAVSTGLSLVTLPLVGRLVDRGARLSVYLPAMGFVILMVLCLPRAHDPWLFGGAVALYGVANSVAGVVPTVITAERVPRHLTGTVVGITRSAGDAGAVVGPLVVFVAYDLGGPMAAVVVIAAVSLVVSLWFGAWVRRGRTETRSRRSPR